MLLFGQSVAWLAFCGYRSNGRTECDRHGVFPLDVEKRQSCPYNKPWLPELGKELLDNQPVHVVVWGPGLSAEQDALPTARNDLVFS